MLVCGCVFESIIHTTLSQQHLFIIPPLPQSFLGKLRVIQEQGMKLGREVVPKTVSCFPFFSQQATFVGTVAGCAFRLVTTRQGYVLSRDALDCRLCLEQLGFRQSSADREITSMRSSLRYCRHLRIKFCKGKEGFRR